MKEGLLQRIQQLGHWRVNLRPAVPLAELMTFQQCNAKVEKARVSLRGWDYPHLNHNQTHSGGEERGANYFGNWCDWYSQIEFWRMYQSGQFLSYNALDDDLETDPSPQGEDRRLNVMGSIYSVTEFVEFAHRLALEGLYEQGVVMSISLNNTRGRSLEAGRGRMPFFDFPRTQAESISITRRLDREAINKGAVSISLSVLLELFDHFGWNPTANQIRSDQESFYRREIR